MPQGPRTLDLDERRLIANSLRMAAGDTRVVKSSWEPSGNIAKALEKKLAAGEAQKYVDHLDRIIGAQERLAVEVENPEYEIIIRKIK